MTEALRSDWLTTGPRVPAFEAALAAATGAATRSPSVPARRPCTARPRCWPRAGRRGDHDADDLRRDRERRRYVGATPVFADVRAGRPADIDPDARGAAVTPRTRAILPVDYAGHPADYDALRAIAEAAPGGPLTSIADASHSLGATLDGRPVGTLADLTVLQPAPGQDHDDRRGRCGLTDRDDLAERLRRFRNHGIATELAARRDWTYAMVELGYNYRLTDIAAALGSPSSSAPGRVPGPPPRALAARYLDDSRGHPLPRRPGGRAGLGSGLALLFRATAARPPARRSGAVYHAHARRGIGVNVHYIPVHHHPYYRERYPGLRFPVAERANERLLTLPLHAGMTDADVDDVVAALDKVTDAYRAA